ncbi:MAG: hypothetical protein KDH17_21140 [Rhodocyclaceae bacterium]|nr:hypothetical protein [Rhodocyclaceae bacterium]
MSVVPRFHLICMAAALLLSAGAHAASFASSASTAGSASVGSVSDSFGASSNSSSDDDDQAAAGDYRITDVAQASRRADHVTVALRSDTTRKAFTLDLPQAVWTAQGLQPGDRVHVAQRPYGFEFARGDTRAAFFLVLHDDWFGEMAARPLAL